MALVASPSQREAIEAPLGAQLVLAGPGAGKTFCLIERVGYLIEHFRIEPSRICAFTFTNKAAGEIAHRLEGRLGERAERIKRGTIHAFCAELLRELGAKLGLEQGFGIADEEYQLAALRRIEGPRRWHRNTLTRFSAHRFRREPLLHNDAILFAKYERFLNDRKLVDFDSLVIRAADLLERGDEADAIRSRWDVILVDEFQDLNPVQYRIIKALAWKHKNVFAVGDDEQSIYSWAGADPAVFTSFANDFNISKRFHLEENRRCPRDVFALARKLMTLNPQLFDGRIVPRADRESPFPVRVAGFADDKAEIQWVIGDIRSDRATHGHRWGDVALLYRKHEIGDELEAAFLNAGIPCRLAQGRALSEDPVVAYVIAALRVIAWPADDVIRDQFLGATLPKPLFDQARAQALASGYDLRRQLRWMIASLPRQHEDARQIRRALTDWRNLDAAGKRHGDLASLVQELLSRRVGKLRSVLDDRHDEIEDPAGLPEVVALSRRLAEIREHRRSVWLPRMGGVEIALKGLLAGVGINDVVLGGEQPSDAEAIADATSAAHLPLTLFKAAQLLEIGALATRFDNFTTVDLETTDKDIRTSEIIEIAAVRVRNGEIVDQYSSLVKPRGSIAAGATLTHGITAADVADAPDFAEVWPEFKAFCGDDVLVAHNGYEFDFPILERLARALGDRSKLVPYDTLPLARDLFPTSRKLVDLARQFGIDPGSSHRALDDTLTLAKVFLELDAEKLRRARKSALVNLLDFLGIALALTSEKELTPEEKMFKGFTRVFALGRFSSCLDYYERELGSNEQLPDGDAVVKALGGIELMLKIRAEKSADERYPVAMNRLRRLIAEIPKVSLSEQLSLFLERVVLSKWDGLELDSARVQLLTLHSTKGLEFSRVYIIGAEDLQLPGGSPTKGASPTEVDEARRLLYVGMTRVEDRLVLTRVATRGGKPTGGHRFLDEMGIRPSTP